ncbi:hydrogen gas-evolving membrane-bound hydrogenase subunit E [Phycisphaerales bacterium AB-hyl4]|uniref:Hydrogen gas-evolving membrane-bound hydrogenase subunit E n=1 Tax=Natronomicrosphaera hydrolytica TaxID=3242702 RepID=A0ABV4U9A6_9BACT
MDAVWLLTLAVLAPLIAGVVTLFLPRSLIMPRVVIATAGPAIAFLLVAAHAASHGITSEPTDSIPWIPSLHLNLGFLGDGIGTFFALLVAGVGVLIMLYARAYFGPEKDDLYRFYPTLGLFTTAMLGIVVADYLMLTLLFWEMTSISSFLLIGWDRFDKKAVKLAMQAFFTTGLGGLVMFGGLLLFSLHTDLWRWSDIYADGLAGFDMTLSWTNPMLWAFVLIFFGAATKSAQFPFHYWLPGAMAAPTPVSAFLHSATMVKAGVFLTGRLFPVFAALELWPWLIIPLGAVTMLLGAVIALNQHDLKRIFAYTTVSQLGLLMCMYGLGALTMTYHDQTFHLIDWDITQIANHAFYKAPLFIVAGALGHVASRQLPELFGAWHHHKGMVLTILLAGWGLAALPGAISFQAKELFLYAIYHATSVHPIFWILMLMAILTAVCNVAIFVRLTTTLLGLEGGLRTEKAPPPPWPVKETAPDYYAPDHPEDEETDAHGSGVHDDHGHAPHAPGTHHEHHHETGFWGAMLWVPALIIVSLQFLGGLITPLWNAVFRPLETNLNYFGGEGASYTGVPALWQLGIGVPLGMSLLAILGGVALGYSKVMRGAIVDVHDKIYPAIYDLCVNGGGKAFRVVQTGNLRDYTIFILLAFLIAFGGAVYFDGGMFEPVLAQMALTFEFWPGVALAVITCATAVAIPLVQARVVRVLLLGACGFSVVGLYLVYEAPDLALTQLMFEIISVILFLLVLRLLPDPESKGAWVGRIGRISIAAAVGLAFGWLTLVAASGAPFDSGHPILGDFFLRHAYDGTQATGGRGAGGGNVVNVILVDFRGFDTLGELVVLALAAVGVWSLIPPRRRYQR